MPWILEDWEGWWTESNPSQHSDDAQDRVSELLTRFPDPSGKTVANFGGGGLHRLPLLEARFAQVVDIAQTWDAAGEVDLRRYARTFDIVIADQVLPLHPSAKLDHVVSALRGTLVEGGLLVVTVPAADRLGAPLQLRLRSDTEAEPGCRGLHEVELYYRLHRAGYQGVRVRRLDGSRPTLISLAVRRANN